jgi:quercetin dioxygenase-like cupin family protein
MLDDPSKYVIKDLIIPEGIKDLWEEAQGYVKTTLWLDSDVLPGAFHFHIGWLYAVGPTCNDRPHTHDTPEIVAFVGSDPDNPHDLCGEVEYWVDGQKQVINRSALVFIPAGVPHNPLNVNRVDRPIIHFDTSPRMHAGSTMLDKIDTES